MKPNLGRLAMISGSVVMAMALLMLALSAVQGASSLMRITTVSQQSSSSYDRRESRYPSMSADGTKIAFVSDSDFLGQGILTGQHEIWLFDTTTMTLTRVSTASSSDRTSFGPTISANGNKVAFHSASDFLNEGIPPTQDEIWLYDTTAMTLTRITTASSTDRRSIYPSLNADGTKISFLSDSDFLSQGIPNDQYEIWLYDTIMKTYTRVTTASDSNRDSGFGALFLNNLDMSVDGKTIAFSSDSDFLGQGILDDQYELWLYDTTTMTLTRVTTASDSSRFSERPSLSAHGAKIAFMSNSDFFDQGIPTNQAEIWLYDTVAMTVTRITTAMGDDGFRDSYDPALNPDGTIIAFASASDLLGEGLPPEQSEIWLYDIEAMTFTRITSATGSGIRSSYYPSLSADGAKIAFNSDADFFNQGILKNQLEIWLYEVEKSAGMKQHVYLPVVLKH